MERAKGLGLVLAGGGAKGAYQLGVWKALEQSGLADSITDMAGTSVGAMNACMFALGNLEQCRTLWQSITKDDILTFEGFGKSDLSGHGERDLLHLLGGGIFSREKMQEMMDRYLPPIVMPKRPVRLHAVCYSVSDACSKTFLLNGCPKQRAEAILLASSALPLVFGAVTIDGKPYLDGGVLDNIPVAPLYAMGIRDFLVMHLSHHGYLDENRYPGARFVQFRPQHKLGNFFNGTLNFDAGVIEEHIQQGWEETWDILRRYPDPDHLLQDRVGSSPLPLHVLVQHKVRDKTIVPLTERVANRYDGQR